MNDEEALLFSLSRCGPPITVIPLFRWRSWWRLLITGLIVAALGLAPRVQMLLE